MEAWLCKGEGGREERWGSDHLRIQVEREDGRVLVPRKQGASGWGTGWEEKHLVPGRRLGGAATGCRCASGRRIGI